ncbi:uncharacterized protein ASCRUDRAFT_156055 [Ascoidea rubescens DSM 1968]|uniref:FAR1 domain-containing protein n=1 Tax=Ascoidea rubescens DSM 1968 TaxID=1344418 RepID=A0A1D2VEZ5_9ASCO|nr:hypothetical protein ASCRUDRAFT_156055 [Ascoidea rubescens DSM 1968]ODV60083.1 hypothetical protein ASCRUDRAFT_156055 [Ascoidea rubescens DSM 1968]
MEHMSFRYEQEILPDKNLKFNTKEKVKEYVQKTYGREAKLGLVLKASCKTRMSFHCQYSGRYNKHHNNNKIRKTPSYKFGCIFNITYCYLRTEMCWIMSRLVSTHTNHDRITDITSQSLLRRRTTEVSEFIESNFEKGIISPSIIIGLVDSKFKVKLIPKDIYNDLNRFRRKNGTINATFKNTTINSLYIATFGKVSQNKAAAMKQEMISDNPSNNLQNQKKEAQSILPSLSSRQRPIWSQLDSTTTPPTSGSML